MNYFDLIENATQGVTVGASEDETGNLKYGGNWLMENTGEQVDTIYFNKGLEYYKHLFTNYNWNVIFKQKIDYNFTDETYLSYGNSNEDNYSILDKYCDDFGINSSTNFIYKMVWDNGKYLIFEQNKEFVKDTDDLTDFSYNSYIQ